MNRERHYSKSQWCLHYTIALKLHIKVLVGHAGKLACPIFVVLIAIGVIRN